MKRSFRKPLVVFAPKSLLRHPRAVSPIDSLSVGSFSEILDEEGSIPDGQRLLLCSGKVYYDLLQKREELNKPDVALLRVEQLYPFPLDNLKVILRKYKTNRKLYWVQEDPQNRGAWTYMKQMFERHFPSFALTYIGREASASPATGFYRQHTDEQQAIIATAFKQ